MLKVHNEKDGTIQYIKEIQIDKQFKYIYVHAYNHMMYIFYINENFYIQYAIIADYDKELLLNLTKFTNSPLLTNITLDELDIIPLNDFRLEQISNNVLTMSKQLKCINLSNFRSYNIKLSSNSQLKNYQSILNVLNEIIYQIHENIQYLKRLNVYNVILESFQNVNMLDINDKKYWNLEHVNQSIRIDLNSDRVYNYGKYNLIQQKISQMNYIKNCNSQWIYLNIDISASVISLFCLLFGIEFKEDIYTFLAHKLDIQNETREEIKKKVFSIIFGYKLKDHLNIQLFNKMYYFSIYLKQLYQNKEGIQSLIVGKPIKIQSNTKQINKGKLLIKYLFNMQTQIYIYLLGLLSSKDVIPLIYQYDSILFKIKRKSFFIELQKILIIISMKGKLPLSLKYGGRLSNMRKYKI